MILCQLITGALGEPLAHTLLHKSLNIHARSNYSNGVHNLPILPYWSSLLRLGNSKLD
jgi:hypothetical protein